MSIASAWNPMGTQAAFEPFVQPIMTSYTTIDESRPHSCAMVMSAVSDPWRKSWSLFSEEGGHLFTRDGLGAEGFSNFVYTLTFSRPVVFTGLEFDTLDDSRYAGLLVIAIDDTGNEKVLLKDKSSEKTYHHYYFDFVTNSIAVKELHLQGRPSSQYSNWSLHAKNMKFKGYHP